MYFYQWLNRSTYNLGSLTLTPVNNRNCDMAEDRARTSKKKISRGLARMNKKSREEADSIVNGSSPENCGWLLQNRTEDITSSVCVCVNVCSRKFPLTHWTSSTAGVRVTLKSFGWSKRWGRDLSWSSGDGGLERWLNTSLWDRMTCSSSCTLQNNQKLRGGGGAIRI